MLAGDVAIGQLGEEGEEQGEESDEGGDFAGCALGGAAQEKEDAGDAGEHQLGGEVGEEVGHLILFFGGGDLGFGSWLLLFAFGDLDHLFHRGIEGFEDEVGEDAQEDDREGDGDENGDFAGI